MKRRATIDDKTDTQTLIKDILNGELVKKGEDPDDDIFLIF